MASPRGSVKAIRYGWLVGEIQRGNVVPIIGPELYVDAQERIADELWTKLELPPEERTTVDTRAIWLRYLKDDGHIHQFRSALKLVTGSELTTTPSPLTTLARITDFPLYISITHDHQLEAALDQVGRRWTAHNYRRQSSLALPDTRPDRKGKLPDSSTLLYLFGRSFEATEEEPPFAVTDAEVIEYLSALLHPDGRPERLFTELKGRVLLFLGCGLPDWLARFFIRVLTEREFTVGEPDQTRIVAADDVPPRGDLATWLPSHGVAIAPAGKAAEFVETLYDRWTSARPIARGPAPSPGSRPKPKPVVFDVAPDDRDRVDPIVVALQQLRNPIPVRFVDDHDGALHETINDAVLFVPFLSAAATAAVAKGLAPPAAWRPACDRSNELASQFIVPVALDDVWPPSPDVFILHAPADAAFVTNQLVPGLQLPRERVLLSSQMPPEKRTLQAEDDAIVDSAFTVAVFSRAFVRIRHQTWAADLAQFAALTDARFATLLVEDCEQPLRIKQLVQLDCRDPAVSAESLDRLRRTIAIATTERDRLYTRRAPRISQVPNELRSPGWYRLGARPETAAFVEHLVRLYTTQVNSR